MSTHKISYYEAAKIIPKPTPNVNLRLQSHKTFPMLPHTQTPINNQTKKTQLNPKITLEHPEYLPTTSYVFQENHNKVSEIERLTTQIKQVLIKELNLQKIINKIKSLQNTILNSTQKTQNIEQDLLLINISNELNTIVNPDVSLS